MEDGWLQLILFLFGDKLTFLSFICIFGIGWCCSSIFTYIFSLGSSVLLLKRVLAETLLFVAVLVQDTYELQALKRYELEKSGKTKEFIELQEKIDNKEIEIFKRKIVRTIRSNFPRAFSNLIEFDSWETLIKNIQKQIK